MSNALITLLVFWGGLLAVILILAVDELAARLGLQPKKFQWKIGPFRKDEDRDNDKGHLEKKHHGPAALAMVPVTWD